VGELHRLDRGGSPPLPAAIAAYLATLSGPEQRNTQRAYRSTLRALAAEFAPPGTRFEVAELDDEGNVDRLTAWFTGQWSGRAAATFNRHLDALRSAASYRPALADLPDQKGWRIKGDAGYGLLNTFARGRIDLAKIRRNWEDIVRVVASIYTGTVRAYDVVTMLQRDRHPTALGEAIAMYGRIFKSLHILSYIDTNETYRRDIKGIRNLQEGRHALARAICHGKKGRAVPPVRARPGEPAQLSRPRAQLRRSVDHRLP
jgi:hypothetical protein